MDLSDRKVGCKSFFVMTSLFPGKGLYVTSKAQIGKLMISISYAVIYVYQAELFPTSVRNSGMGACVTVGQMANFAAPYIVQLVSSQKSVAFPQKAHATLQLNNIF